MAMAQFEDHLNAFEWEAAGERYREYPKRVP